MFGVVLWSDEQEQKAVIWCEDHGDLAFYRNTDATCRIELDAGDWVQFDLTMERHQRFAYNPRLVSEGVYPGLADALCAAPAQRSVRESGSGRESGQVSGQAVASRREEPALANRDSAQIIPFVSANAARRETATPICLSIA